MRKFLSMILAIVMIISVLPVSAFATEEVAETTEVSTEAAEILENYGTEVTVGSNIYYIEDGDLLYSSNNGRPKTVNNDVTWIIEEGGEIYYSKLDGYNTYIYKMGEELEIAKIFCPVECFDVSDDGVYYLYNGEITKINLETKEETIVTVDKTIEAFCIDAENNISIIETVDETVAEEFGTEEIVLQSVFGTGQAATVSCYSKKDIKGKASLILYNSNAIPVKIFSFYSSSKIILTSPYIYNYNSLKFRQVTFGSEGWYYVNDDELREYFAINKALGSGYINMKDYYDDPTMLEVLGFSGRKISFDDYIDFSESGNGDWKIKGDLSNSDKEKANNLKITDLPKLASKTVGKIVDWLKGLWNSFVNALFGSNSISLMSSSNTVKVVGTVTTSEGQWYMLANSTYVKKSEFDKYFTKVGSSSSTPTQNYSSSITISSTSHPSGDIIKGNGYGLRGSIKSALNMSSITGQIINVSTGAVWSEVTVYPNAREYNITANATLNTKLTFGVLAEGTYYLKYTVKDIAGGVQTWQSGNFNVVANGKKVSEQPTINVQTIEKGRNVTIACSDGNAQIHYTLNGTENTCYNSTSFDLTTEGSYNISAWTTRSEYDNSAVTNKTVSVTKVLVPEISDVTYGTSNAWVTISGSGSIYYTKNGTTPTVNSSLYSGTIYIDKSTKLKAFATSYGQVDSDVVTKSLLVAAPDSPTGLKLLDTKEKIAQGKTATVTWDTMPRATNYEARLYYNGKAVGSPYKTKGTTASFKLDEVGEYTIKVKAKNFVGTSSESEGIIVESMAPVTVTFIDRIIREDEVTDEIVEQIQQNINNHYKDGETPDNVNKLIEGNVISVQKIDYDSKPSIPVWEDKEGLSRQYFSKEAYELATEDKTVYAYYSVKSYSVQFWNYWRDYSEQRLGETQHILYSFSAEAPTDFEVPTGYVMAGWNVDGQKSECYDFTFVNGNMKLDTVYTWKNEDLPVILEILKAKRGNTCETYEVDLKYVHYNKDNTKARIIVTLYTADNKVVDVATKDVYLMPKDAGFDYKDTMTIEYPDQVSRISAVMVQIVDDKTGGAVSEMVNTTNIEMPTDDTYWTKWSSWSTTQPGSAPGYNENDFQGIKREIETKTQYRYRNKDYTSSASSSLSGWTQYDKKRTSWSKTYGPVYSNPSNGSRNVWSEQYVTSSNYKTVYRYYRYANSLCAYYGSSYPDYSYYYEWEFDYPLELKSGTSYSYKLWCGCGISGGYHTVYSVNWQGHGDYPARKWVSYNYGTRWYYQDPVYTYYYWKLLDWSSWSDSKVSGDETQTRKVYRYRDEFNLYQGYDPTKDSKNQEETKKTYDITGNIEGLETDFNGKLATILVYKKTNTDPTQEQLEYVDQVPLGENNSYSFVVNPKHEIDYYDTGDYIVTLSIEGCDKLVNIDVIKAPVPQQTVTFQNYDGAALKNSDGEDVIISVDKGGSIDVYDLPIPEKEGYTFVKWDKSLININEDMTVTPVFARKTYNVVFVDYENRTAHMVDVQYGSPVALPDVEEVEGKVFTGWDIENYKFAKEGKIDTDVFTSKEETPYYRTSDDNYILTTEYNPETDEIIDETLYYKYFPESNAIISESKIITTKWDTLKYNVKFCDFDGSIVSEQEVEYGCPATLPEEVEKEDGMLCSWDITGDEWWNVTQNMVIYPYVPQIAEVDSPTITASTDESYDVFLAELETSSENGKIYYSVDEELTIEEAKIFARNIAMSDKPDKNDESTKSISLMSSSIEEGKEEEVDEEHLDYMNNITEYNDPVELYAGSVVYAFTIDSYNNISPISVYQYEFVPNGEDEGIVPNELIIGEDAAQIIMPTIVAEPGETVTVPVEIKNNPGLTNLSLLLAFDEENLELKNVENGNVFSDNEFEMDLKDDGSCKFEWETIEENYDDGILLYLTFKVADNITKDKHIIDISIDYNEETTENEQQIITVPGAITEDTRIIGDVNGDGEIDFADGIRILKHDVGLIELTGDALITADVNGDGEVDFVDAIQILKFDSGLISSFKK